MITSGELADGELDHGVFDSLASFDETSQVQMIEAFASKDLAGIRNKTVWPRSVVTGVSCR